MPSPDSAKLAPHVVALNYFSILFIITGITFTCLFNTTILAHGLFLLGWFYLVPPLLARIIILLLGKPAGLVSTTSRTHTVWWCLFQLQLLFNRFPFLEEILRVIPGLYALWLNLWGAKVNLFSFWAPGVTVMDRYHLDIGKGAILGTGCLLSAHILVKKSNGEMILVVDKLTIGANALIGVHAMLPPGCHIHASEIVPANKLLKPYTEILGGKSSLLRTIDYR